jgi:hypothetical protein
MGDSDFLLVIITFFGKHNKFIFHDFLKSYSHLII